MSPTTETIPKPNPAKRPRVVSRKSPVIKAQVIAKRTLGMPKAQIARETGLARMTVNAIVSEADLDNQLENYRTQAIAIVPRALESVHDALGPGGDASIGIRYLEGMAIIGDNAIRSARDSARATAAINVLVQAGANVNVVPGAQVKKDDG